MPNDLSGMLEAPQGACIPRPSLCSLVRWQCSASEALQPRETGRLWLDRTATLAARPRRPKLRSSPRRSWLSARPGRTSPAPAPPPPVKPHVKTCHRGKWPCRSCHSTNLPKASFTSTWRTIRLQPQGLDHHTRHFRDLAEAQLLSKQLENRLEPLRRRLRGARHRCRRCRRSTWDTISPWPPLRMLGPLDIRPQTAPCTSFQRCSSGR